MSGVRYDPYGMYGDQNNYKMAEAYSNMQGEGPSQTTGSAISRMGDATGKMGEMAGGTETGLGAGLKVASTAMSMGGEALNAYQSWKAQKAKDRLAKKMEGRMDQQWARGLRKESQEDRLDYLAFKRAMAQEAINEIDRMRGKQAKGQ